MPTSIPYVTNFNGSMNKVSAHLESVKKEVPLRADSRLQITSKAYETLSLTIAI